MKLQASYYSLQSPFATQSTIDGNNRFGSSFSARSSSRPPSACWCPPPVSWLSPKTSTKGSRLTSELSFSGEGGAVLAWVGFHCSFIVGRVKGWGGRDVSFSSTVVPISEDLLARATAVKGRQSFLPALYVGNGGIGVPTCLQNGSK